MAQLGITTHSEGECVHVHVRGELDLATAAELDGVITCVRSESRCVLLDLSELSFMDSSGLRVLETAHREASRDGWELGVLAPRGPARRVFEAVGADRLLPLVDEPA